MSGTPVTRLLQRMAQGDRQAEHDLLPLVYDELHRMAEAALRGERPGHTLQATALVHEVWLRFASDEAPSWKDHSHFLRVAARAMRNLLVDHARARRSAKRSVGTEYAEHLLASFDEHSVDVLALHAALEKLRGVDEELALLVDLRFFAGLTGEQTAAVLETSPASVDRAWRMARAWLRTEIPES